MAKKTSSRALTVIPTPNFPKGTSQPGTSLGEVAPNELDALGQRIRAEFDWIESAQKMIPLRVVLLGIVLAQIQQSLNRGQWLPYIKAHLRGKTSFAYRAMDIGRACVAEAKLQLPQLVALRQLQLDGKPSRKRDDAQKTLKKMERWIAARTFAELRAAYSDRQCALGGARNRPAKAVIDLDALKAMKREEAAGLIERARSLLLRENILQYLAPPEVKNFVENFHDLAVELKAAAKTLLKEIAAT